MFVNLATISARVNSSPDCDLACFLFLFSMIRFLPLWLAFFFFFWVFYEKLREKSFRHCTVVLSGAWPCLLFTAVGYFCVSTNFHTWIHMACLSLRTGMSSPFKYKLQCVFLVFMGVLFLIHLSIEHLNLRYWVNSSTHSCPLKCTKYTSHSLNTWEAEEGWL
jgi:hypothetical protein